jgi:hypothetical protein
MITVKVTYENNDTVITGINLTIQESKEYYLNNIFNLGQGEHDLLVKAVKVEQIN